MATRLVLAATRGTVLGYAKRGAGLSTRAFDSSYSLSPLPGHRFYGWTHYGVMIPKVAAPHQYLSVMVMAGMPGQRAFDVDDVVTTTPRDTATVSISTAAAAYYGTASMRDDCIFDPGAEELHFGAELAIGGRYPEFNVEIDIPGLTAQLRFTLAERATWFVQGRPYDHLSLLGQYTGWIQTSDARVDVSGVGNIEYARCVGPYALRNRLLPWRYKAPVDFFTYHVIELSADAQLLFCRVGMLGDRIGDLVQLRTLSGDGDWRVNEIATARTFYDVLEYQGTPSTDSTGNHEMLLPHRFRLGVRDRVEVIGTTDTPARFGVGRGYIAGYRANIEIDGRRINTRGYSEFVDVTKEATNRLTQ
ncbi:DUF6670 family protein [Mycolicibacterium neworleansense]|uniref:DUF6670 family protein n=1 Tax=Mycolicibacterium neworleansense TaxID=146018 RepID=UPI000B8A0F25|nr:DUF6670 family protein [Mycolicibacterium neworleansense]MCV7360167.1 hypothetical protein [Mycolicibacterium neworleansense]